MSPSAPAGRVSQTVPVAYFLAIFILLGGLISLHVHVNLPISDRDVPWTRGASAYKNIAQDNAKFSWDLVRIYLGSIICAIANLNNLHS